MTKASRRRRTGETVPRAEKFGDLITADHKVLNEVVTRETVTDTLSWYKIPPLNGYNLIRAKQKLLKRRTRVYEGSSSRHRSQRSFIQTIHWSLGNRVKNYHGIIERLHLIDPRLTELPKGQYAE